MSLILMLTGKSNVLATIYFPAIDLSDDDYELGLMNFETYTISNVNALNNFILTKTTWKGSIPIDHVSIGHH